jgi:DNA-binding CsgD family transcriptional regulator
MAKNSTERQRTFSTVMFVIVFALIWLWLFSCWNSRYLPVLNEFRSDFTFAFSLYTLVFGLVLICSPWLMRPLMKLIGTTAWLLSLIGLFGSLGVYIFFSSSATLSYGPFVIGVLLISISGSLMFLCWAHTARGLTPYRILVATSAGWALSALLFCAVHLLPVWLYMASLSCTPLVIAVLLIVGIRMNAERTAFRAPVASSRADMVDSGVWQILPLLSIAICALSVGLGWNVLSDSTENIPWVIGSVLTLILLAFYGRLFPKWVSLQGSLNLALLFMAAGLMVTMLVPGFGVASSTLVFVGHYSLSCVCLSFAGAACDTYGSDAKRVTRAVVLFGTQQFFLGVGSIVGFFLAMLVLERIISIIAVILFFGALLSNNIYRFSRNENETEASRPTPSSQIDMPVDTVLAHLAQEHRLTQREKEVLMLLGKGYSAASISELQVLSVNTIRTQVRSIYNKLGIHSKKELLDLVNRHRDLLTPDD